MAGGKIHGCKTKACGRHYSDEYYRDYSKGYYAGRRKANYGDLNGIIRDEVKLVATGADLTKDLVDDENTNQRYKRGRKNNRDYTNGKCGRCNRYNDDNSNENDKALNEILSKYKDQINTRVGGRGRAYNNKDYYNNNFLRQVKAVQNVRSKMEEGDRQKLDELLQKISDKK